MSTTDHGMWARHPRGLQSAILPPRFEQPTGSTTGSDDVSFRVVTERIPLKAS
jgi:hypothetical protein